MIVGENSQDSKNPTEKPVGETQKKITDEYYCKCCFTFEDHENSIFLQCVVVPKYCPHKTL